MGHIHSSVVFEGGPDPLLSENDSLPVLHQIADPNAAVDFIYVEGGTPTEDTRAAVLVRARLNDGTRVLVTFSLASLIASVCYAASALPKEFDPALIQVKI
jgi:hypothetical protein